VVGYAAVNYFFLTPRGHLGLSDTAQVLGLVGYVFTALCLIWLGAAARRYQGELRAQALQLQREKDLLAVTLAGIGDGVITCDAQGRLTMLNGMAVALTGWTSDEAAGLPIDQVFRIVNERSREPAENPAFRAMREARIVELANHALLLSKDGREIPIDDSAAPIVDAGTVVGAVLVFRDISEARRAFDALAQADRRKSEFLAILGHELRSPLSAVLHAAHAAHNRPGDAATVEVAAGMIMRQARQLARLVEDLLDVSRIERGDIRLKIERVPLEDVVRQAAEASGGALQAGGHRLRLELPERPIELDADGQRLSQVLANLLINAARYSPEPDEIRLAASIADGELKIAVTDHGMGIKPQDLERIFQLFTRVERSGSHGAGLGIGLALSRSLVELHGGSIDVESDGPGKGSCFTVTLPLRTVVTAA
jgi:PAS domain S-box-containing protein